MAGTNGNQRNAADVAIELLGLFLGKAPCDISVKELQELYLKFYATAKMAEVSRPSQLKEYLPENLKKIAEQF